MKGILCSDWLPERARWAYLTRVVTARAKFFGVIFWPFNKSFIYQACLVELAGYWPGFFFFFCVFMDLDFVSVHKNAKKNLANIQPS